MGYDRAWSTTYKDYMSIGHDWSGSLAAAAHETKEKAAAAARATAAIGGYRSAVIDPRSTLAGFTAEELMELRHVMQRNNLAMIDLLSALKDI